MGIENHLQSDGLEYTYNNTYPPAARTLYDNSALFISTRNADLSAIPSLNYNYDSFLFLFLGYGILPNREKGAR